MHTVLRDKGLPTKIGLYFHSVHPDEYGAFTEMIRFFRERNYRFVSPDDFLRSPDERSIYISFDDNYRAWHDALAMFDAADVRVTFFTNTCCFRDRASEVEVTAYYDRLGWKGERVPLSTSELMDMDRAGHTIGAHTHSHHCLTDWPASEARADIRRGKVELEAILGHEVRHFSYPYGMRRHFSESLRSYCCNNGFATVTNAIPGLLHGPQSLHALNRSLWRLDQPLPFNLQNLSIDGTYFEKLTGRSCVG